VTLLHKTEKDTPFLNCLLLCNYWGCPIKS